MNILFIGDIVGKLGRKALAKNLSLIKQKYNIDFVIANGENITNGKGISLTHYNFLIETGVDAITLGNHYAHQKEIYNFIDNKEMIRPLNLLDEKNGSGSRIFDVHGVKIRVSNLLGTATTEMKIDDPYNAIANVIGDDQSDIHIIDFHAEYTGEKKALALSLKNSISAFIGTHTHVQTNDAQILTTGVLYISDVGMCGYNNGVLGTEANSVIERVIFKNDKARFKQLDQGETIFNAVILNFDDITFKGKNIITINIIDKE